MKAGLEQPFDSKFYGHQTQTHEHTVKFKLLMSGTFRVFWTGISGCSHNWQNIWWIKQNKKGKILKFIATIVIFAGYGGIVL
jgi:hypothetical protein